MWQSLTIDELTVSDVHRMRRRRGEEAALGKALLLRHARNEKGSTSMTYGPPPTAARLAAWFMRRTAPSGVRRVVPLKAAVASDVGVVREENQDRVAIVRGCDGAGSTFIVAALADGIGGMKSGAECASLTMGTFLDAVVSEAQHLIEPREWLWQASMRANKAVHDKYRGDGGSTLVALLLSKGHSPLWLSIGDSRVYFAGASKIRQLSRDDTLEGQFGRGPGARRSDLLQFVGIGDSIEPHIEPLPWDETGTMMLTSDGVHFIEEDYLAKVIHFAPDVGMCAKRLTELAKMLGGPDNASVAAVSMEALSGESDPPLESSFEVWDPFGELQVIFDRGASRYPSQAPMPTSSAHPVVPKTGASQQASAGAPAPGVEPAQDKQRKPKKGKKKPDEASAKNVEGSVDVPQLLIEFPNKTP